MKDRVLKLLKKMRAKDYCKVWGKGTVTYEQPLEREGFRHEWNYYKWAGMYIHHNIATDKIIVFCDGFRWDE